MKSIDIVSKIVAREGEAKASPSKGIQSINLSDYLLKSVWDKVFEVRTDSQGAEYIFGKLPMVTQYGITMFSGEGVNVPSLASGLPFDGRTIWYNPDTQQIEVIGGTGGGSGEGVSNFWDLSGIPSWITISKPKYTYSEIEGTPDLTKYALASQIPSLSGYATESWVAKQNYATKATTLSGYGITDAYTKTNVDDLLKAYVTLTGTQTITGEKNFTGGLKVNGSPIVYDATKKYWKLEGDLLVTGGVTMYGNEGTYTPSTIMDAIAVDGTTISKSGGVLKVIGGTGGGVADSVAWANITGKPTWIGSSKPTYSYSEITGAISTTELQNYLTSNSYLNVTSGDNRYLKLSGGTISLTTFSPLNIYRESTGAAAIGFYNSTGRLGNLGFNDTSGPKWFDASYTAFSLLHGGNYSSYALPLSGGTINSTFGGLEIKRNNAYDSAIKYSNTSGVLGYIGFNDNFNPMLWNKSQGELGVILHSGNYSQYALPLSGGTLSGNLTIQNKTVDVITLYMDDVNNSPSIKCANKSDGTLGYIGVSGSGSGIGIQPFFMDSAGTVNKIWHSGNDGSGSGLDADLLDGKHATDFMQYSTGGKYVRANLINSELWSLAGGNGYIEYYDSGIWFNSQWGKVTAHYGFEGSLSGNASSATKLQTARTIWGQTFDGTGNVVGSLTNAYTISYNTTTNGYLIGHRAYYFGDGVNGLVLASMGDTPITFATRATEVMRISYSGNVGIGTASPSAKLHVSGNILATGGITMYSMRKLKNVVNERGLSLSELSTIKPTRYTWKDGRDNRLHFGGIADDIQQVLPEVVYSTSDGILTMDYGNAAFAVASSLIQPVVDHEKRIAMLEEENKQLRQEVERLKSA